MAPLHALGRFALPEDFLQVMDAIAMQRPAIVAAAGSAVALR
jgi:hypothetical protein